ncbi:MAG: alpha-amylase, partial [Bacteroidales bacterium]|nr:alpha-amylase [Bacteroidales bacterium]
IYAFEEKVRKIDDLNFWIDWRYLQTSDHFYYMCTKWFSDGDVHKYFNHYDSPYEAYMNYANVLSDFRIRLDEALDISLLPKLEHIKFEKKEEEPSEKSNLKKTASKKTSSTNATAKKSAAKEKTNLKSEKTTKTQKSKSDK